NAGGGNGGSWLNKKNGLPCRAEIDRLKNAAIHWRHVKNVRLRGDTANRPCPPAAIRSDISPAQNRIELSRARLAKSQKNCKTDSDCTSNASHKSPLSSANTSDAMF